MLNKINTQSLIFSLLQDKLDKESLLRLEPFKWQQIYQASFQDSASLIIYSVLKKRNLLDILPQEIRNKWKNFYYNNLKRNILALEQIRDVQDTLKEDNIKFILLKGLALISIVYSDLGLRAFVDIDLLVKKDDLSRLKYKLEALGYSLQNPKRSQLLESFGCGDWIFLKPGLLPLDIHWQLCQYERFKNIIKFNEERIFQDAVCCKINHSQLLSLSKEDLFLYLSMHLALVHKFRGLVWFYDLKAVLDFYREDFDWDLLIEKAQKANLVTVLFYVLYFSKNLLGINFPNRIIRYLKPSFMKRKLINLFISKRKILRLDFPQSPKSYYICQGFLIDGLFNIIHTFWRMLFPSREWLLYHYPKEERKRKLRYSFRLAHIFNALFSLKFR